jgi:hypothetical protein
LPEAQQQEIKRQVTHILEDDVITPSSSGWNFPLLVVPKKLDASGKRRWRICKLNEVMIGSRNIRQTRAKGILPLWTVQVDICKYQ